MYFLYGAKYLPIILKNSRILDVFGSDKSDWPDESDKSDNSDVFAYFRPKSAGISPQRSVSHFTMGLT